MNLDVLSGRDCVPAGPSVMGLDLKGDVTSNNKDGNLLRLAGQMAKGVVALFGTTGLLYGAGFLALRSHFAYLGIWSGVPTNSNLVAEEGGRFFYHLIFLPAGAISNLIGPHSGHFYGYGLAALLLGSLLWDRRTLVYRVIGPNPGPRQTRTTRRFYAAAPVFFLVICLAFTTALLIPQWQIVSLQDVVRAWDSMDPSTKAELDGAAGFYNRIVIQLLIAIAVAWWLYRAAWPTATRPERVLLAAQWLLVFAAVAALPVVYGRLLLPTTYPVFSFSGASPEMRLLIEQTPDSWILWNRASKTTEIVPKDKAVTVSIGERQSLFTSKRK